MPRRTHCPEGRPIYRHDDLPADRLATVTMLKRMRRRLAEGQQPVASYLSTSQRYSPLYEVAASVELPPLTPGQQARRAVARTCWRCGVTRDDPFPCYYHGGKEQRRLCEDCRRRERLAECMPSWLAGRLAASAWAREVLADPQTVLIHVQRLGPDSRSGWPFRIRAAAVDGTVLLGEDVCRVWLPPNCPERKPGQVLAVDIADKVRALLDRRLVAWGNGSPLRDLFHDLAQSGEHHDLHRRGVRCICDTPGLLRWHAGTVAQGDDFGERYTSWRMQRLAGNFWPGSDGLARQRPPDQTAAQILDLMPDYLRRMADDDHPDGPAVCPVLPVRSRDPDAPPGIEPCGAALIGPRPGARSDAAGRCAGHTPGASVHLPDTVPGSPLPGIPGTVRRLAVAGQEQWGGDAEVDLGQYGLFYINPADLRACTGEGCDLCADPSGRPS
jgi:hypothetical protein